METVNGLCPQDKIIEMGFTVVDLLSEEQLHDCQLFYDQNILYYGILCAGNRYMLSPFDQCRARQYIESRHPGGSRLPAPIPPHWKQPPPQPPPPKEERESSTSHGKNPPRTKRQIKITITID